jgi:hypothetical protein
MILHFLLLAALFAASKKRFNPYAASAIFGAIEAVLHFLSDRNLVAGLMAGIIYTGLAATMVYMLSRVDQKEEGEEHYSKYGHIKEGRFKWEYIPLSVAVVLILFGETVASILMS